MANNPKSSIVWCGGACAAAYEAAHPDESAGWIKVEDLSPGQMEQLVATLSPRPAVKA